MALKDLLVYLTPSSPAFLHVELASDLASRNASFVTALFVREWTPKQLEQRRTAELAGRPLGDMEAIGHAARTALAQAEAKARSTFEELIARNGLQSEWRAVDGEPRTVLAQQARYADLCILGAETHTGNASSGYRVSEELLFSSGRPVLLVPEATTSRTLGAHVAVAWNSSRSAARALNDALPLLECSDRVTVIAANPAEILTANEALPLSNLLEHLRRHGVLAQVIELSDVPAAAVAGMLQEKARAAGADLLVAGAHGHTWLREVLLGSVTRDLLANLALPIMMSH
ncbi:MAG TPA: universal stress protein [Polyangiaceae bacterium]|nr:universal stress protein [Polyangiaceae bacterium]